MKIICPYCGKEVSVNKLGRKPLNLNGVEVYASLQAHGTISATARKYGVSRASIRKAIKNISKDK
jgi:molybdenum-dependent DNA-binding transcriptional regulator ModE